MEALKIPSNNERGGGERRWPRTLGKITLTTLAGGSLFYGCADNVTRNFPDSIDTTGFAIMGMSGLYMLFVDSKFTHKMKEIRENRVKKKFGDDAKIIERNYREKMKRGGFGLFLGATLMVTGVFMENKKSDPVEQSSVENPAAPSTTPTPSENIVTSVIPQQNTLTTQTAGSCAIQAPFAPEVIAGAESPDVLTFQQTLNAFFATSEADGGYGPIVKDGKFGPQTDEAWYKYAELNGIAGAPWDQPSCSYTPLWVPGQ